MIKLQNIKKEYGMGGIISTALSVNLEIKKGEFVVITGCSGSGKSTLLNILTGIDRPTSGKIEVADKNITDLDENQMAKWRGQTMGIVFQFFQLIPNLSVIENVLLPMDLVRKNASSSKEEAM